VIDKERIRREVQRLAPELAALSRLLFDHPELGYREYRAAEWLSSSLARDGFEVQRPFCDLPTAWYAEHSFGPGGPCIALLAEYDALPEVGHGCGHNLIGVAAVGAARALARAASPGRGRIVVIGCPAEEGGVEGAGGKVRLLEAGAFAGVDAAMLVHPASVTAARTTSLAREALELEFRGRRAVDGLVQFYNSVNSLRQHLKADARIHGVVTEGGRDPVIIPDRAVARFYVRSASDTYLTEVVERLLSCAKGAALSTGVSLNHRRFSHRYARLVTNEVLAERFTRNVELLGHRVLREMRVGGSTDMGNVSQVLPALHAYVALTDRPVPGHTREFARETVSSKGRRALLFAATALAWTAYDLLLDERALRSAWEEHQLKAEDDQ